MKNEIFAKLEKRAVAFIRNCSDSQETLAELFSSSQKTISRIACGEGRSLSRLLRFADTFYPGEVDVVFRTTLHSDLSKWMTENGLCLDVESKSRLIDGKREDEYRLSLRHAMSNYQVGYNGSITNPVWEPVVAIGADEESAGALLVNKMLAYFELGLCDTLSYGMTTIKITPEAIDALKEMRLQNQR